MNKATILKASLQRAIALLVALSCPIEVRAQRPSATAIAS